MTGLTPKDIAHLSAFRGELHRHPELSGAEKETARRVRIMLSGHSPDRVLLELGGHGLGAVYNGRTSGPTVMIRGELDALPIQEEGNLPYKSESPGKAHLCGHDGHMAILAGVARLLHRKRPSCGRVVLLFQPAEETGAGAAAVLEDPRFSELAPEWAFALHNRPGLPLGHVGLAEGPVNCASRGMKIHLKGKEAHASEPQNGVSPAMALSALIPRLTGLSRADLGSPEFQLVTLTHMRMGAPAFGIAPGEAELFATLRSATDAEMAALVSSAEILVEDVSRDCGITSTWLYEDVFHHCENHPDAVAQLRRAMDALEISHDGAGCPMSASEDFGRFAAVSKSAMFFLGSGPRHAALHNPDYDFPDTLIPRGVAIFERVIRNILG